MINAKNVGRPVSYYQVIIIIVLIMAYALDDLVDVALDDPLDTLEY
jgi:hypothetical protein